MSGDAISQILKQRREFIRHLEEDVTKNDALIDSVSEKLNKLSITTENVRDLGKKVEHCALIPLGKRIYVHGTIVHTGEYSLDKPAFPDSYSTLETLDQTIQHLKNKIKSQSELLKKSEDARAQLRDRINLLQGGDGTNDDSPQEIISDKGVAVKVGDFYEILEFEN